MKTVLIVQRRMTHYRVPFFCLLRERLAELAIDLKLAYGTPTEVERLKSDEGKLDWAIPLDTKYFAGGRLCIQPFFGAAKDVDLMILTHENKLLLNLIAQYFFKKQRIALWGHGANLQGNGNSLRESFKRRTLLQADWWFAYTDLSRQLIEDAGFPPTRISTVNNAINTDSLQSEWKSHTSSDKEATKAVFGINSNSVGAFIGSLYSDKRLDFLIAASKKIRESIPDFHLIIAGDGPQRAYIEHAITQNSWIRYLGPVGDRDKARILSIADIMLNPGLVGLGILDSFSCRCPMLTTDCGTHSPEIAYLQNEVNGLMTENSIPAYSKAAIDILQDKTRSAKLRSACGDSAERISLANMTANFSDGIESCLKSPPIRH